MGKDMGEAVDALFAIGPGAEPIRLNGEHGRPQIAEVLAERYAPWQREDDSVVGRASVWIAATNPG